MDVLVETVCHGLIEDRFKDEQVEEGVPLGAEPESFLSQDVDGFVAEVGVSGDAHGHQFIDDGFGLRGVEVGAVVGPPVAVEVTLL